MKIRTTMIAIGTATLALTGCDGDSRLAEQAEQHSRQQAEQSLRMAHLQQEVVALHKEVQIGQHDLSHERDKLEEERRRFAAARKVDPVIASAISMAAMLLASVLPLIICWQLLRAGKESSDDGLVTEMLLQDMVSTSPILLPSAHNPALEYANENSNATHSPAEEQTCPTL